MYEEWLEREIYNHLVCFCEEDADFKTTPVFVEVPVATAAQEGKGTPVCGTRRRVGRFCDS